jgi:hypothetical protein
MTAKWESDVRAFIGSQEDFSTSQKKLLKQLPAQLTGASVKQFLQNNLNELSYLVTELPGDDILHSIRKLLKDLSYNWPFVKKYKKLLPSAFSEEEKIKSFTELLGLFLDKSVSITLLETYCKDCGENGLFIEEGAAILQKIEASLKNEKEGLSRIIYLNPGLMHPLPVG